MPGLLVFRTLGEALRAGFQVYDKTERGYLVRAKIDGAWQLAVVEV